MTYYLPRNSVPSNYIFKLKQPCLKVNLYVGSTAGFGAMEIGIGAFRIDPPNPGSKTDRRFLPTRALEIRSAAEYASGQTR